MRTQRRRLSIDVQNQTIHLGPWHTHGGQLDESLESSNVIGDLSSTNTVTGLKLLLAERRAPYGSALRKRNSGLRILVTFIIIVTAADCSHH